MKLNNLALPFAIALFAAATTFSSCNGSEGGSSTPVDSTVQEGTAPVSYEAGTPDTPIDTTLQGRDARMSDTMAENRTPQAGGQSGGGTMQGAGGAGNTQGAGGMQGTGSMQSNTTDKRTTSGSAPGTRR